MNNHAHILLKTDKITDLSKYMHNVNMLYGMYYNKKYNRVGYVFRDRFKSGGIYSEDQLYSCINYIFNNPVKVGICSKPEDYLYSNYKKINTKCNNNCAFIDVAEDSNKIIKQYFKQYFLKNSLELADLKSDEKRLQELTILLKQQYNLSLREISAELKINREKIRKIYKNSVNKNRPH